MLETSASAPLAAAREPRHDVAAGLAGTAGEEDAGGHGRIAPVVGFESEATARATPHCSWGRRPTGIKLNELDRLASPQPQYRWSPGPGTKPLFQ